MTVERQEAVDLLHEFTHSQSLRKHTLAVEVAHKHEGQTLDGECLT